MTNQQKQTYLRERINDLLGGELKKLEFGVEILVPQNSGEMYHYRVCDVINSNTYLQVKAPWEGLQINKGVKKIVLARNCAITDDTLERYAVDDIEIIGREPSLADVLRAIDKQYKGDKFATVASNGWFHFNSQRCFYNLALPFSQQDEAVYDLLIDILK